MTEEKQLTGYPSVDKPWLDFYSEEARNCTVPEMTAYQYIYESNKDIIQNPRLIRVGQILRVPIQ